MRNSLSFFKLAVSAAIGVAVLSVCPPATSQEVSYALLQPGMVRPVSPLTPVQPGTSSDVHVKHHFWDRENTFLFAATAAFNSADFVVTRDNLRSGGQELNPMTRPFAGSTPALAVNFAGETAGVVGLSYLFHKTGHHRLERFVSMANIGSSAAAVSFDMAHR